MIAPDRRVIVMQLHAELARLVDLGVVDLDLVRLRRGVPSQAATASQRNSHQSPDPDPVPAAMRPAQDPAANLMLFEHAQDHDFWLIFIQGFLSETARFQKSSAKPA